MIIVYSYFSDNLEKKIGKEEEKFEKIRKEEEKDRISLMENIK